MNGFENHAGISLSNSKIQLVEIVFKDNQFLLENVDEAYFNETIDFEKDKETKITALIQSAYNELLIKKRMTSKTASFALPFELFYMMQVPYDNTLLHQDLIEEFRWELSILYPFVAAKELVLQYVEIEKNNIISTNTALVAAIPRKFLQIILNFCTQNKLKLRFIDNIHIASDKALSVSYPLAERGLILSVFITAKYLSLFLTISGKPVYYKLFHLNDASEIPSLLLNELTGKGYLHLDSNLIDSAFICGDELSLSTVAALKRTVKFNFIRFNPFEKIKPALGLYSNKNFQEKNNSFSPAAGISYRLA